MLNLTTENVNDRIVLKCRGRIVKGEEMRILCTALPHHGQELTIDLSEVTAIDAAGIGALVALQASGIYFKLVNPSQHVRGVLRLTKLDSIVEISNVLPATDRTDDRISGNELEPCFSTGD